MAVFGVGAYYSDDVSDHFINQKVVGTGWSEKDAPELREYFMSLKVGDIVYIKSVSPSSKDIIVKGIGVISDNEIIRNKQIVTTGRNVKWIFTKEFRIKKPIEKNNVRMNTIYEEFHPDVLSEIIQKIN